MRKYVLLCLALLCLTGVSAQNQRTFTTPQPYKSWGRVASITDADFFRSAEGRRIADNVLLYQQITGGWPKNIYMAAELTDEERAKVIESQKDVNESTIDNSATSTEIRFLSYAYGATGEEKYKDAVLRGIQYLLDAQYDNGGWPQFYPRPTGYYIHITYNDNAMINVMELLRKVYEKQEPYAFVPDAVCEKARNAFDKGVDCILKTQYRQNGKLTVWCAQHDRETLEPAKARAYELPSLSGMESDDIVLLLMSLPKTPEIVTSVEGAVAWFKAVKIDGLKREIFTNDEGKKDYRMVPCTDCETLWARFYTLEDNRPFFCDRDGIKRYDLSEIGHERRNGYSWYNSNGNKVLKEYEKWLKK